MVCFCFTSDRGGEGSHTGAAVKAHPFRAKDGAADCQADSRLISIKDGAFFFSEWDEDLYRGEEGGGHQSLTRAGRSAAVHRVQTSEAEAEDLQDKRRGKTGDGSRKSRRGQQIDVRYLINVRN